MKKLLGKGTKKKKNRNALSRGHLKEPITTTMEEQEEDEEVSWRARGGGGHYSASINAHGATSPTGSPKESMIEVGPPRRVPDVFTFKSVRAFFFFFLFFFPTTESGRVERRYA